MALKSRKGLTDGLAISDSAGQVFSAKDMMMDSLLEVLENLFESDRFLFLANITTKEILWEPY
jgi:hypothetical protein